jgi:hypothetical protein
MESPRVSPRQELGQGTLSSDDLLRHSPHTHPYLKLHTYRLHLVHVITVQSIMGRDMCSQK